MAHIFGSTRKTNKVLEQEMLSIDAKNFIMEAMRKDNVLPERQRPESHIAEPNYTVSRNTKEQSSEIPGLKHTHANTRHRKQSKVKSFSNDAKDLFMEAMRKDSRQTQ